MKLIKIHDALKLKNSIFIDVRSPEEYQEATIPGSINIPIFSDEERTLVGTTYKQVSPKKAREVGLNFVAPKLLQIVNKIKEVIGNKIPIIFCWRGGERSKNLCAILDMLMIAGYRLEGGYKAYRSFIIEQLKDYHLPAETIVLHGYTGTGKTRILYRLAELGHPVLDLEGLAGHRGSAFGSIGIKSVRNQKQFDALLFNRLEDLKDQPYILLEAESKRIGRVNLPEFLFKKKEEGLPILTDASLNVRVKRILEDYVEEGVTYRFLEVCQGSLNAIQKKLIQRIGKSGFQKLEEALWNKNLEYVTEILLTEYYDPLYQHSQNKYDFTLRVNVDNLELGVKQIDNFLKARY